jgi:HD-like signal output (HDOD) protein/ActR/RegA family two-component response regulator
MVPQESILFVDDEYFVRRSIGRVLGRSFDVHLASSGEEALGLISLKGPFTMVISDIDMPGLNGTEFLSKVREISPKSIRMIISGRGRREDMINAINVARVARYIPKPITSAELVEIIEGALAERGDEASSMSEPIEEEPAHGFSLRLKELVRDVRVQDLEIPVLTPLAAEVQEMLFADNVALESLMMTITKEPKLAVQVLTLANSPRFRPARPLINLREACLRLGSRQVLSIAQAILVKDIFLVKSVALKEISEGVWSALIKAGTTARRLAKMLLVRDPGTYFTMGFLHNIGEMMLVYLAAKKFEGETLTKKELDELGSYIANAHEAFGGIVLKKWAVPISLHKVAQSHHRLMGQDLSTNEGLQRSIVLAAWGLVVEEDGPYLSGLHEVDTDALLGRLGLDPVEVRRELGMAVESRPQSCEAAG